MAKYIQPIDLPKGSCTITSLFCSVGAWLKPTRLK